MSDAIKHECGIALVRLLKPLEYYKVKYGSWRYGLQKLYLLMEKQHNRGQDGAGAASLKLNLPPGVKYIHNYRSNFSNPIQEVFAKINKEFYSLSNGNADLMNDPHWAKENLPFAGEIYLGHLRYGTFGMNNIEYVHPVTRENNWRSRSIVLAGNFNLTNVDELFQALIEIGQNPKDFSDTVTVLENIGHFLDEENQKLFEDFKRKGFSNKDISPLIETNLDVAKVLNRASNKWDGGYAIGGLLGHGDAFVVRDPWGIRPAFYYYDDEIAVVASERPVIQTVMNTSYDKVKELPHGKAIVVKASGDVSVEEVRPPQEKRACSFERIYFSRGSDKDIYIERKELGRLLTPQILHMVDKDLRNTVFSFIPNTAETAFYGMVRGMEDYLSGVKLDKIQEMRASGNWDDLERVVGMRPRVEKIAVKDVKLRTFIAEDAGRDDLVEHVYDITYDTVQKGKDNLVIIDDSIVRGTTLKKSIIKILDRLEPKKIVIVSSSPQIRYPDCYGIDMAKLSDFIAFKAVISLLRKTGRETLINTVYQKSKSQEKSPKEKIKNYVKDIYAPFSNEEISAEIASMLHTSDINAEIVVVYQTVENLHAACPGSSGDWYFTGNYPTPGGNKVVNTSFINFIEGKNERAY